MGKVEEKIVVDDTHVVIDDTYPCWVQPELNRKYFPSIQLFDVSDHPYFISEDESFPNLVFDGFFLYLVSMKKPERESNGKYLFFSGDNRRLFDVAVNEIQNHGFCKAQLVMCLMKGFSEYVLFIHWCDGSRCHELFERNRLEYHVKFRGWKSYAKTKVWHSEGYLKKLEGLYGVGYKKKIEVEREKRIRERTI
ncbi:hypothetical protein E3J74_09160 [Candidatus Bathyarchaeota archaeon]|nr:MAG: hypothetical protein E3J74_09160 [Candidatus Bathyarchaeota archaeon]